MKHNFDVVILTLQIVYYENEWDCVWENKVRIMKFKMKMIMGHNC